MFRSQRFNLFHIVVIALGVGLFFFLKPNNTPELSFYGFAESNETKINYNYPVVVNQIHVKPGQFVKQGEVLLELLRIKPKESLEDQQFRIAKLRAEISIWKLKKENELTELRQEKKAKLERIEEKIVAAQRELEFKKSLSAGLKSIESSDSDYQPIKEKIEEFINEKLRESKAFDSKVESINSELSIGQNPYQEQIKRLRAEQEFDESQKIQYITVEAPFDGLIGSVSCKEEEHISSYSTLLSFYEPHSKMVKGYVHEDLTLQVKMSDQFNVSSLKDPTINYVGKVVGLGSRIVEIPTRLRKMVAIKSYGREVLVEIDPNNSFLQKEKVSLSFVPSLIRRDE